MGKFVNNTDEFYKYCEENEVEFVDFRFTDIKGTWHHISYRMSAVEASMIDDGVPFDGSSIENWQPIEKSDMLLKPDVGTAFMDPFTADSTVIVICDVYDIYKNELYERCPRSIAKKTLKYMEESGVGDDAFFGPENEFFIFDDVRIWSGVNQTGYRVDSEEGEWNRSTDYGEVGNMGHQPGVKGGYFPVMPTDTMVDLRAEMMLLLEEVGLTVMLGHHEVAMAQGEIILPVGASVDETENEFGTIDEIAGRYFLTFKKLVSTDGKVFECIHSGDLHDIILPVTLPGYTILRRGITEALEKKGLTEDSTPMNLTPKEEK